MGTLVTAHQTVKVQESPSSFLFFTVNYPSELNNINKAKMNQLVPNYKNFTGNLLFLIVKEISFAFFPHTTSSNKNFTQLW